jgi:4-hydroxy-2-oxoheptanedioate aldolase
MQRNTMQQKLLAGQPALGVVSSIRSAIAAGLLARAGCAHVLIDHQHGEWNDASQREGIAAVYLQDVTPVVRVTHNDYSAIGRVLDAGALGVIVPMVNTPAEAQAAAFAMRYPPHGGRSSGDNMMLHLGSDYAAAANAEVFLAVQIETAAGLANVDAIMAVAGVDGCWVGPADLALSLGVAQGSPEHTAALHRILQACRAAGKVGGMFAGSAQIARRWIEEGYLFVTVSGDTALLENSARSLLHELRAAAPVDAARGAAA